MEYRNLGRSGLKVSVIGVGTNQFGGKVDAVNVRNLIDAALGVGINLLDTANIYQAGRSETTIGEALKGRRETIIIASKFRFKMGDGPNQVGASRKHIMDAVHASLTRLQTDYIDLYQIHGWDADTPIEETMRTLNGLVTSGKVRYIGASNFTAWQLAHANAVAAQNGWEQFVSVQPHYHLFERNIETELIPACEYFNIGILPYFPLAGGFLTGKYKRGEGAPEGSRGEQSSYVQKYMTDDNYDRIEALTAWAEARDHSINELAHAWLAARPQISSVISGATRVEHILANAKSGDWVLTPDEVAEIDAIIAGENA